MMILYSSLILGLASSLHCMGMCGPLALAVPLNRSSNLKVLSGLLQYNAGRLLTYALLGFLAGTIGLTVNSLGVLQWISIFSGILLLIFAWKNLLFKNFQSSFPLFGLHGLIGKGIGSVLASGRVFRLPLLGLLNGLLPCGMVYLALMNALLSGTSVSGAMAMAAFGLGTLPAMLFVGFAANRITGTLRQRLSKFLPVLLSLVALLIILRGMNLNIPYLSPKVEIRQVTDQACSKTTEQEKSAEMSCCHPR